MGPSRSSRPAATRVVRPRRITSAKPTSCASVHVGAVSAYAVDSTGTQTAIVKKSIARVRQTRTFACMAPLLQRTRPLPQLLRGRLHRGFQVLRIPGGVTFESILLEAGTANGVGLAGIDDQFGLAAEPLQSLIELLAADDRHVHVGVAAEDERRRHDLVHPEERRELDPE